MITKLIDFLISQGLRIETLLDKYALGGIDSLEDPGIFSVPPFPEIGSVIEIYTTLGGREGYDKLLSELEASL